MRRRTVLQVEGAHHIPTQGPVLLACRHVHHLYDGCVLLVVSQRPVHLFIALDWVPLRVVRRLLEAGCRLLGWPVVLRPDRTGSSVARPERPEIQRAVRRSVRAAVDVLVGGNMLAIFPEGYPNVDPVYTPKMHLDDFLPFRPGFASIVDLAQAKRGDRIPVIPVGFSYRQGRHWAITMRCGPAVYRDSTDNRADFVARVESRVKELSG